MAHALHHATRTCAASLLITVGVLLAACDRRPPPRAPEDLPRGSYLGSGSPVTSREASREPARARPPVALSTRPPVDNAGIDVPWNSSAARQNWQPIETSEPEDTSDLDDQVDENDKDGEDGDNNNVDEKDNDDSDDKGDNQGPREDAPQNDNNSQSDPQSNSQSDSQKSIKTKSRKSSS